MINLAEHVSKPSARHLVIGSRGSEVECCARYFSLYIYSSNNVNSNGEL